GSRRVRQSAEKFDLWIQHDKWKGIAPRWGARTSNPVRGVRRLWWVRLPLFSATSSIGRNVDSAPINISTKPADRLAGDRCRLTRGQRMLSLFSRELTLGWKELDEFPERKTWRGLLVVVIIGYISGIGMIGLFLMASHFWQLAKYLTSTN